MRRENGFYWVKRQIVWHGPPMKIELIWEVAKYEYGNWHLADNSIAYFYDDYFQEIDENRITHEQHVKYHLNLLNR